MLLLLENQTLKLVDPQDQALLHAQPVASIRVWGVGRDSGRWGARGGPLGMCWMRRLGVKGDLCLLGGGGLRGMGPCGEHGAGRHGCNVGSVHTGGGCGAHPLPQVLRTGWGVSSACRVCGSGAWGCGGPVLGGVWGCAGSGCMWDMGL